MPRTAKSPIARSLVAERYWRDKPKPGAPFEEWVEGVSEELGIPVNAVRRMAAEEQAGFLMEIRNEQRSTAMQIADMCGASVSEAIGVLAEGMRASKRTLVKDTHGVPLKDEKGEYVYHETPLWGDRIKAAEAMIRVHGAAAPEKIEFTGTLSIQTGSEVELLKQWDDINLSIAGLRRDLQSSNHRAIAVGNSEGATNPGATGGAAGETRPLVLVDGVYQDPGRTGSAESVQAVS